MQTLQTHCSASGSFLKGGIQCAFVGILWLVISGCAIDHHMALEGTVRSTLQDSPSFEQLMVEYQTGDAFRARNTIIRRLLLLDDEYFQTYSNRLVRGRAIADTGSEIINTSLTTAATA